MLRVKNLLIAYFSPNKESIHSLGLQIPSKKVFNLLKTPQSTFLEGIWSPRGCSLLLATSHAPGTSPAQRRRRRRSLPSSRSFSRTSRNRRDTSLGAHLGCFWKFWEFFFLFFFFGGGGLEVVLFLLLLLLYYMFSRCFLYINGFYFCFFFTKSWRSPQGRRTISVPFQGSFLSVFSKVLQSVGKTPHK